MPSTSARFISSRHSWWQKVQVLGIYASPQDPFQAGLHDLASSKLWVAQHVLDGFAQGATKPMVSYFGIFCGAFEDYLIVYGEDGHSSGMPHPPLP